VWGSLDSVLGRLLHLTVNNVTIPSDWKETVVVPINKGYDRSLVSNYRSFGFTSVINKQMEHAIASYLREIWKRKIGYSRFNMDYHAKVK
jgi:hypothetical protein